MKVIRMFLEEYLVRLEKLRGADIIEILILATIIYFFLKWIKTTNAWAVLKGLTFLLIFWLIAFIFDFHAILWLFVNALGVGITALIIIFQPELRKVLEQLGQHDIPFFGSGTEKDTELTDQDVEGLLDGIFKMAKVKTGVLIVIEQKVDLEYIIKRSNAVLLDSLISSGLLISIFEDKKPLHDGAVIIRGRRIRAATCYLPLSDNMQLSKDMGTRHRAGVGISEVADSLTIIVSEERGEVSIARNGELIRGISREFLKEQLEALRVPKEKKRTWLARRKGKDKPEARAGR